jgi:glycosyltransferase involved in cell wall biosynthesis
LRVAVISTGTTGGAALAALRLHHGLRSIDVDSRFICRDTASEAEHIYQATLTRRPVPEILSSFVKQRLAIPDRRPQYGLSAAPKRASCELFSDCRSSLGRRRQLPCEPFDVINLHWISQFLDLETILKRYAGKVPIVWTLHDMNAMTGGCHYDAGCGKFTESCHTCPHLIHSGPADPSNSIFREKDRLLGALGANDLHFVTPSRWLADQVRQSKLLSRFPVTTIANGIDTDLFRPISPAAAREALGISCSDQVLLFVAESVSNPRKGFDLLVDALRSMRFERPTTLLCVGRSSPDLPEIENVKTVQLGSISNALFLPLVYSSADVFVIPSRQDNLPNTVLESISSGTPVVGFSIGGISDLVTTGQTGWLANSTNRLALAESLATALSELASPHEAARIRKACRQSALSRWSQSIQAEKYSRLYVDIMQVPK